MNIQMKIMMKIFQILKINFQKMQKIKMLFAVLLAGISDM
jgi:hypothetical protein